MHALLQGLETGLQESTPTRIATVRMANLTPSQGKPTPITTPMAARTQMAEAEVTPTMAPCRARITPGPGSRCP